MSQYLSGVCFTCIMFYRLYFKPRPTTKSTPEAPTGGGEGGGGELKEDSVSFRLLLHCSVALNCGCKIAKRLIYSGIKGIHVVTSRM